MAHALHCARPITSGAAASGGFAERVHDIREPSTHFRLLPFVTTLPLKHSKVALEFLRRRLLGGIQVSGEPREPLFHNGDKATIWQHGYCLCNGFTKWRDLFEKFLAFR